MSSAWSSQSASDLMKKVVFPESPYGVPGRQRLQLLPAGGGAQDVGHGRRPRLLAELGGDDLRVQPATQRVGRQDQPVAELTADLLGLLVEEDHHHHRCAAPSLQVRLHLPVAQQVVVDLLTGVELDVRPVHGREHPGVGAVPRVVVDDVVEVPHPPVDAEQVERGRADEVDRLRVRAEERADL
jgi:hypothetical protein